MQACEVIRGSICDKVIVIKPNYGQIESVPRLGVRTNFVNLEFPPNDSYMRSTLKVSECCMAEAMVAI